jgi:DNA-directed RNA polymerase sigma subunit (sigma70/sigma32)
MFAMSDRDDRDDVDFDGLWQNVEKMLDHLPEPQRSVMVARFGLDRGEPRLIDEVAQHLGMEVAEVTRIEVEAMAALRAMPPEPEPDSE